MTYRAEVRKEALYFGSDIAGLAIAFGGPVVVVWVYSLLDVGRIQFSPQFRETDPTAVVLSLAVWLAALAVASTSLYRERIEGVMERLAAAPFRPFHYILAKGTVLGAMGAMQGAIVPVAGALLLPAEVPRNGLFVGTAVLASLAFAAAALGILLSAVLRSMQQIGNTVMLVTLVSLCLSGFLKPLGDLGGLGRMAGLLPFTTGYRLVRQWLDGSNVAWVDVALLAAEGLAALLAAWALVGRPTRRHRRTADATVFQ